VALERRNSQLDASKDRRSGISAPDIPSDDRLWREGSTEGGVEVDGVQTDPSADMSSQWEEEQAKASRAESEMQKELVRHSILPPTLLHHVKKTIFFPISHKLQATSQWCSINTGGGGGGGGGPNIKKMK
jgi:hypothetical protein